MSQFAHYQPIFCKRNLTHHRRWFLLAPTNPKSVVL